MDKNIIKTVIGSLHKEISDTRLVHRPMTFEGNVCYVLVGIRRAGKSYLMMQDIKQRIEKGDTEKNVFPKRFDISIKTPKRFTPNAEAFFKFAVAK